MNLHLLNRPFFYPAYRPHGGWQFWLLWVGFTILGSGLGMMIGQLVQPLLRPYILGLAVGLLQGMLLRQRASGTLRWTLATMLGVVLSSLMRPRVAFFTDLATSGAVGGLVIGGIQGLVFYTQIPGMAWWVLVKMISGAVSWGLGWAILGQVSRLLRDSATGQVMMGVVTIALIWGLSAAMTAPVMYRLLARRHGTGGRLSV